MSKHPPRIWVKLNNDVGDLALDFKGYAPMFPPDHKIGGIPECNEPYLSLSEHQALLAEREREARAKWEEIGMLKERLKHFTFQAEDPDTHHTIRQNAREERIKLLARLMRIGGTELGREAKAQAASGEPTRPEEKE